MRICIVGSFSTDGTSRARLLALRKLSRSHVEAVDVEETAGRYAYRTLLQRILYRAGLYQIAIAIRVALKARLFRPNVIIYDTFCPWFFWGVDRALKVYLTVDSVKSPGIRFGFRRAARRFSLIFTSKPWELGYVRGLARCPVVFFIQPSAQIRPFDSVEFMHRRYDAGFLGHRNKQRKEVLGLCAEQCPDFRFLVSGPGWRSDDLAAHRNVEVVEKGVYGKDYFAALSSCRICLGFLNDSAADLFTTRTVEVPASGAVLMTRRTRHQVRILGRGGAVFVENYWSFPERLRQIARSEEAFVVARKGNERIRALRLDWAHSMGRMLQRIEFVLADRSS